MVYNEITIKRNKAQYERGLKMKGWKRVTIDTFEKVLDGMVYRMRYVETVYSESDTLRNRWTVTAEKDGATVGGVSMEVSEAERIQTAEKIIIENF